MTCQYTRMHSRPSAGRVGFSSSVSTRRCRRVPVRYNAPCSSDKLFARCNVERIVTYTSAMPDRLLNLEIAERSIAETRCSHLFLFFSFLFFSFLVTHRNGMKNGILPRNLRPFDIGNDDDDSHGHSFRDIEAHARRARQSSDD